MKGRWDEARRAGHVNAMCPAGYARVAEHTRALAARILAELPAEDRGVTAARRYVLATEGGGLGGWPTRAERSDIVDILAAARLLAARTPKEPTR